MIYNLCMNREVEVRGELTSEVFGEKLGFFTKKFGKPKLMKRLSIEINDYNNQGCIITQNSNKSIFVLAPVTDNGATDLHIINNANGPSSQTKIYKNSNAESGGSICQTKDNGFAILSSGLTLRGDLEISLMRVIL